MRVQLGWAVTQNNLGDAPRIAGGTASLVSGKCSSTN
jgi:hypothetical protein